MGKGLRQRAHNYVSDLYGTEGVSVDGQMGVFARFGQDGPLLVKTLLSPGDSAPASGNFQRAAEIHKKVGLGAAPKTRRDGMLLRDVDGEIALRLERLNQRALARDAVANHADAPGIS